MAVILTIRKLILELLKKGDPDDAVCITQGNSHPDLLITEVDDNGMIGLLNLRISPLAPDFHSFIKTEAGKEQLELQGFLRDTEKDHCGGYNSTIEDFLRFILEKEIPLDTKMIVPLGDSGDDIESYYLEYDKKRKTIKITYS